MLIELSEVHAEPGDFKESVEISDQRSQREHILAGAALLLVILIASLWWSRTLEQFPVLPEGIYQGKLTGLWPDSSSDKPSEIKLLAHSDGSDQLYFVVDRPGWAPQFLAPVAGALAVPKSSWLPPMALSSSRERLTFAGRDAGSGKYSGRVRLASNDQLGHWELQILSAATVDQPPENFDQHVALFLNLRNLQNELERQEQFVKVQTQEINRFSDFITDGERFRERANERYNEVNTKLTQEKEVVARLRLQAQKLEAQVLLAQKLTERGLLVNLARDSLDREARWIQSLFNSEVLPGNAEFITAVQRADKTQRLREEIAKERDRIYSLRQGSHSAVQAETKKKKSTFDSIWSSE